MGAKRPQSGGKTSSEWAKRPGGEMSTEGASRPGGETLQGQNVHKPCEMYGSVVVTRCSRWWSCNVETNSAKPGSDGDGKPEVSENTADNATDALKTQLADIEVQSIFLFYFCRTMLASSVALVIMRCLCVRPSVRPSRLWILSKQINRSSKFFHLLVEPSHSSFSTYQMVWQYSDGKPLTGASNAGGVR